MRPALRRLFLLAVRSDTEAELQKDATGTDRWETRCLHCRRRLLVRADGEALGHATLEHVVPQAWFGKRAATALTALVGDDPDDPRNLAIACAGCNHEKGVSHETLAAPTMRARWRLSQLYCKAGSRVGANRPAFPQINNTAPASSIARY